MKASMGDIFSEFEGIRRRMKMAWQRVLKAALHAEKREDASRLEAVGAESAGLRQDSRKRR